MTELLKQSFLEQRIQEPGALGGGDGDLLFQGVAERHQFVYHRYYSLLFGKKCLRLQRAPPLEF